MRGGLVELLFHRLDLADLGLLTDMLVDIFKDSLLHRLEVVEELVLALLVPVKDVVVELDEGHQLAVPLDHKGLIHTVERVDHLFDLLRVDVLAGRPHDHVPEPSLDVVASFGILAGKIVGAEPAVVGQHGACPFRVAVVAQHHVVTLGDNLALAGLRVHVLELDLHVVGRHADRPHHRLSHAGVRDQRRGLCQAVADRIGESGLVEEVLDGRIQL